ncbi:Ig-like domain-containing protein, partial [Agathobaculum butyriciproducens]|nr:Ig-like domain-containing protein [Agathobaculum butyriciproducens]
MPNEDTVYIGKTLQLTPVFTPENVTDRDVTWTTSDETKATVDANGVVTGVEEGTAVITATYKDTTNDNRVWTGTC